LPEAKEKLMRIHLSLRHALLLLVLAAPTLVRAQFQPPTDEELKMTADPKAPGAAAVYLNVEEVTDDPMHFHSFYARIKVLEEKGKDLATVNIPYQQTDSNITDIKGRTIHPDGTVIPLEAKPEDLLIAKTKTKEGDNKQFNRMVFTLPSVEVGSILEYRYQLRYGDYYSSPLWEIQRPYFVHKAHYAFTPAKVFQLGLAPLQTLVDATGNSVNALIWWWILPSGVAVKSDAAGRFSIDLTEIPPIPEEQWMPPIESILYKVLFYYSRAGNGQDYWISEAKRWSKEVDHFAEPSKSIRETVSGLIAPGDSDLDKAKKLYKAVQALDNTDFSRKKGTIELKQLGFHVAKRAEDTWSQKSGSSEDITLLYLAMLRAAGLTANDMKVVDRDQGVFAPGYLNFGQLTDDIIILSIGGKDILLDPGQQMCPFQIVHWKHSGAGGVLQSHNGKSIATSPFQLYTANTLYRTGEVNLGDHGAITGDFRFIMTGQEALRWRQAALENDEDEVNKRFDRWIESVFPEGVEAHIVHFIGLNDPDVNLIAMVKAQGTLGSATSKRLLLPGFFFETRGRLPFVDQEKRLEPVDMQYGDQVIEQVVYHLPPGLAVEGAPQEAKIPWEGHAVLVTKSKTDPGQITIARILSRSFTIVKPEEYQSLRDFYRKVAAADQQQLILTSSPAAKDN
jgi:hypothetical protein